MIALVRVDNRLIHGQVVSTWIPYLEVERVVVADDEAARSMLMKAAMTMALPPSIEVKIARPSEVDWKGAIETKKRVLVLARDVLDAEAMMLAGLLVKDLNLGNVHFGEGRRPVSPSVYLSEVELEALSRIAALGVDVEARAVPSDPPVRLEEIRSRYRSAK